MSNLAWALCSSAASSALPPASAQHSIKLPRPIRADHISAAPTGCSDWLDPACPSVRCSVLGWTGGGRTTILAKPIIPLRKGCMITLYVAERLMGEPLTNGVSHCPSPALLLTSCWQISEQQVKPELVQRFEIPQGLVHEQGCVW